MNFALKLNDIATIEKIKQRVNEKRKKEELEKYIQDIINNERRDAIEHYKLLKNDLIDIANEGKFEYSFAIFLNNYDLNYRKYFKLQLFELLVNDGFSVCEEVVTKLDYDRDFIYSIYFNVAWKIPQ